MKSWSFKNNKSGYLYLLTPKGISDKGVITARFLKRKVEEYERLKAEIADIQSRIEEWVLRTKSQNWVSLNCYHKGDKDFLEVRPDIFDFSREVLSMSDLKIDTAFYVKCISALERAFEMLNASEVTNAA